MEKKQILNLIMLILLIILLMILIPIKVRALNYTNGTTGDTTINKLFDKQTNANRVTKKVSEFKTNEKFWITGYAGDDQIFRSRAILCTQRGQSITDEQDGKRIEYEINGVYNIYSGSNDYNNTDKGLAYIMTFNRNSGNDFNNYSDTQDYVQKAYWKYIKNFRDNLSTNIKNATEDCDNVTLSGDSQKLYYAANAYKNYVNNYKTYANIQSLSTKWINDYSELQIDYKLSYTSETNYDFANVSKVSILYGGKTIKTINSGFKSGDNSVTIEGDKINDNGGEIKIVVDYYYTSVSSRFVSFIHNRNRDNTKTINNIRYKK